jgi:hypothetical protein
VAVGRKIEDGSEAQRCLSAARRSGLSAGERARGHATIWLELRSPSSRTSRSMPVPEQPLPMRRFARLRTGVR